MAFLCHRHLRTKNLKILVFVQIAILVLGLQRGDAASDSFSVVMGGSCICPGEVISYRCTVVDDGSRFTSWGGTAVDAAFTEYNCDGNTMFNLAHPAFDDPGGLRITCGEGALVAQSVGVMMSSPDNCYTSEFTVTAFPGLDGTVIECSLSGGFRDVGNSSLTIAGPQSAPVVMSVRFGDIMMRQFTIVWNNASDISCDPIEQYAVSNSGPDEFCNPSGGLEFVDASTMEYQCSDWPPSSLGQTYTFRVAAFNCGNQMGNFSGSVSVDFQVPEAPTLPGVTVEFVQENQFMVTSVVNETTTVVTVATLPDGSTVEVPVRRYRFSYIFADGSTVVDYVLSVDCGSGTCTSMRSFDIPATSQVLLVSVAAENVIGVGDSSERNVSICSPQELSELPVRENNGSACGIGTPYYVPLSEGTGRACFNGITDGSMAAFSCYCNTGLYTLSPLIITETTCQNGRWNNIIPSCVANCTAISQRFPFPTNTLATPDEGSLMIEDGRCQVMYNCEDVNFPFVVDGRNTIMFIPDPVPDSCRWENPPNCTNVEPPTDECDCIDLTDMRTTPTCSMSGGTISDAIPNGMVEYSGLAIGSGRAVYSCNPEYSLSGENHRMCQGDGSWNGSLPECVLIPESDNIGAIIGGVVGGIGGVILVLVIVLVVCLWYRNKKKNKGLGKSPDERELREHTRSADAGDVEVAEVEVNTATYADPSAIDRQEFPGTQDVYTVVDKTKKTHEPEDHMPTYQTPEEIKREAAPATGEMYTVPEAKKGSKKNEAPPPQKSEEELHQMYSQVDMGKKHQPPSGT